MGVGPKIRELRTKSGLTQKNLADALYVTYQAVSRWENGDTEPSFDTLKSMCKIFNCSLDELFEMEKPKEAEEKQIIGVCEVCHKPIYDESDLSIVEELVVVKRDNRTSSEKRERYFCNECRKLWEERNKEEKRKEKEAYLAGTKKRRIESLTFPWIATIVLVVLGIVFLLKPNLPLGISLIAGGVFAFTFLATMFLKNTFIPELWSRVGKFYIRQIRGIIFQLNFEGTVFLIIVKAFFLVAEIIVGILGVIFTTIIEIPMSIFVYPMALIKNFKEGK